MKKLIKLSMGKKESHWHVFNKLKLLQRQIGNKQLESIGNYLMSFLPIRRVMHHSRLELKNYHSPMDLPEF